MQNQQLTAAFAAMTPPPAPDAALDDAPLAPGRAALERPFDAPFGGVTGAPKFPHPNSIERCMRHWYAAAAGPTPDLKALYMASLTLTRMAEGGLYAHLG